MQLAVGDRRHRSRSVTRRCSSTRACRDYLVKQHGGRPRPDVDDRRHPRDGVQGRERRPPLEPVLPAQARAGLPGRARADDRPATSPTTPTCCPLDEVLASPTSWSSARPTRRTATSPIDLPGRRRVEPARQRGRWCDRRRRVASSSPPTTRTTASGASSTAWSTRSPSTSRCSSWSTTPTTRRSPPSPSTSGRDPRVRTLVNTYGRGPANAIRYGIDAAAPPRRGRDHGRRQRRPAADRPAGAPGRARRRGRRGLAATRPAGSRSAGPLLKGAALPHRRAAPWASFARVGTDDATNSFKAYDTDFVREVGIDSRSGFEIGLELTAKARRLRRPVAELPTIWLDRTIGRVQLRPEGAGSRSTCGGTASRSAPSSRSSRSATGRRGSPRATGDGHARTGAMTRTDASCVTGSAGFIGGYVVEELLARGYDVDRHRQLLEVRPGRRSRTTTTPRYRFVEGDVRDVDLMVELLDGLRPPDRRRRADRRHLLLPRLRLRPARHQRAHHGRRPATPRSGRCRRGRLQKVTYLSSSMVFESTDRWPSREGDERTIPPPLSSYGFQKLAVEYFARAAPGTSTALPYTIVRPFNCVGVGEGRALGRRRDPQRQREARDEPRRARPGPEGAEGPGPAAHPRRRAARCGTTPTAPTWPAASSPRWSHPAALNEDFNLSTAESTTVLELAELIWRKIHGADAAVRGASATTRSSTTCSGACPTSTKAARRARLRRRPPPSTRCSTRSSRGWARRWPTA